LQKDHSSGHEEVSSWFSTAARGFGRLNFRGGTVIGDRSLNERLFEPETYFKQSVFKSAVPKNGCRTVSAKPFSYDNTIALFMRFKNIEA
jgi:hypothetical protein